jgi:hypothetical protein
MIKYYKSGTHFYKVDEDSDCCHPILHVNKKSGGGFIIGSLKLDISFIEDFENGSMISSTEEEFDDALATAILALNIEGVIK